MRACVHEGVGHAGHAEFAHGWMIRREGGVTGDGCRDCDRLSLLRFRTSHKRKKNKAHKKTIQTTKSFRFLWKLPPQNKKINKEVAHNFDINKVS